MLILVKSGGPYVGLDLNAGGTGVELTGFAPCGIGSNNGVIASGHLSGAVFSRNGPTSGPSQMANPKHVKLLQRGVDVWNNWREKGRSICSRPQRGDRTLDDRRGTRRPFRLGRKN